MKITIAPSLPQTGSADGVSCTVLVEHPYDDLDGAGAVRLMKQALLAWGYAEGTLDELLGRD